MKACTRIGKGLFKECLNTFKSTGPGEIQLRTLQEQTKPVSKPIKPLAMISGKSQVMGEVQYDWRRASIIHINKISVLVNYSPVIQMLVPRKELQQIMKQSECNCLQNEVVKKKSSQKWICQEHPMSIQPIYVIWEDK